MLALTIITWVLSGLLALLNLMAGAMKIKEAGRGAKPMPTLLDYSERGVRLLGAAEVLGAIGLIVPALIGGPVGFLAPVAALALSLVQFLAIFAHRKHGEPFTMNIAMMLAGIAIAVLRFLGA